MVKLFVTSLRETVVYIYLVQRVARDRRPLDQVTNAMIAKQTTVGHGGPARPDPGRAREL